MKIPPFPSFSLQFTCLSKLCYVHTPSIKEDRVKRYYFQIISHIYIEMHSSLLTVLHPACMLIRQVVELAM